MKGLADRQPLFDIGLLMHELAVTQSTLDLALKYAGGRRITAIYLVVGELSSIVDDSVQFYWDFISRDTLEAQHRTFSQRLPADEIPVELHRVVHNGG